MTKTSAKKYIKARRKGHLTNLSHFEAGGNIDYKSLTLFYLIKSRYKSGVVYGRNKAEVARKLGITPYQLREYTKLLKRKKLLEVRRIKNKGVYFITKSIKKYSLRSNSYSKIVLYSFDTFKSIEEKLKIHNIKRVINSQDYVKRKVEQVNADPQGYGSRKLTIRAVRAIKSYIKKYGASDFAIKVIGMRRLSFRTGINLHSLTTLIKRLNRLGMLKRKAIVERNGVRTWEGSCKYQKGSITEACRLGYVYEGKGGSIIRHFGTAYEFKTNVLYLPFMEAMKNKYPDLVKSLRKEIKKRKKAYKKSQKSFFTNLYSLSSESLCMYNNNTNSKGMGKGIGIVFN